MGKIEKINQMLEEILKLYSDRQVIDVSSSVSVSLEEAGDGGDVVERTIFRFEISCSHEKLRQECDANRDDSKASKADSSIDEEFVVPF